MNNTFRLVVIVLAVLGPFSTSSRGQGYPTADYFAGHSYPVLGSRIVYEQTDFEYGGESLRMPVPRVVENQRVSASQLLPVPVDPGNLLLPDQFADPTLGFGVGVPLRLQDSAAKSQSLYSGMPENGPVILLRTGVNVGLNLRYDTGFQTGLSPSGVALPMSGDDRKSGVFSMDNTAGHFATDVQAPNLAIPVQGYFDLRLEDDGLTLRQIFGRFGNLLGGKNWTAFGSADMLPRTIVTLRGPAGGIYRDDIPQLQYMLASDHNWVICVAIEDPISDDFELDDPTDSESDNVALQRYPDLVTRFRVLHPGLWGSSQVAVMVRGMGYEDRHYQEHHVSGWGVSGNTRFKVYGDNNLRMGIVGGQGIGRYIYGLEDAPSAVFRNGHLQSLHCFGTYAGYQHLWTEDLFSNFCYGFAMSEVGTPRIETASNQVHSSWIDLVWAVNGNFAVGVEYAYAAKESWDGRCGDNHQIMFSLQIGTVAADSNKKTADRGAAFSERAYSESDGPLPRRSYSNPGYSLRM